MSNVVSLQEYREKKHPLPPGRTPLQVLLEMIEEAVKGIKQERKQVGRVKNRSRRITRRRVAGS